MSRQVQDRDNERLKVYRRLSRYLRTPYERVRERRHYTRREVDPLVNAMILPFKEIDWSSFDEARVKATKRPGPALVYVEAVPGIEAVRIGRTVDLPQRVRRYEDRYHDVEVILTGTCNVLDPSGKEAENRVFSLLNEIHLSRHNLDLFLLLPTHDWYLPDRHKILKAFWGLTRGPSPLFCFVETKPSFECFY